MPFVFSARTSTDPGNGLGVGSDGGLYLSGYTGGAGHQPTYMLDTSVGAAGQQFAYSQHIATANYAAAVLGTAIVWPFAVTRSCRAAGAALGVVTAGAGSTTYHAVYGADATTGLPGGKLADLCSFNTAATGVANATMLSPDFPFAARTLYWLCAWVYGTVPPTFWCRDEGLAAPVRLSAVPTVVAGFNTRINAGYSDTSVAWATLRSAPATLAPVTTPVQAGWLAFTPQTWWLLTNA